MGARFPKSDFKITTRDILRATIASDLECRGLPAKWNPKYRITNRISYFQWLLRRTEYLDAKPQRNVLEAFQLAVLKLRKNLLGERLSIEIPRHVCGPGLSIAHAGNIVVNGRSRIGSRCRIHQGVSIVASEAGAPKVGNDVFIGPNVVIVGPVSIGDGAYLYPGAVVTRDVPPSSGARGVPARVCEKNDIHSHGAAMRVRVSDSSHQVVLVWDEHR
ncbi:serine acetyltransferase [Rhodococcus fascians]|nr:serine acetyltransferase [Rhodococcus fascians]MBY4415173.1 serine acetyltransferase [Rhodococcus fascians]